MSFSKPLAVPAVHYQSDPRQLGSGCKNYTSKSRNSSSSSTLISKSTDTTPPSSFVELDEEISKYTCSSHYKTCAHGRGGCFGRNFISDTEVRATEMLRLLSLYREKTRKLNKNDLEQFVLNSIFKKHCTNIDEVISQTQDEHEQLFGKACGEVESSSDSDSSVHGCRREDCGINCDHLAQCIDSSFAADQGGNVDGGAQKKRKFAFCHPSSIPSSFKPGKKSSQKKRSEKKFEYDWTINIDAGYLPDHNQTKLNLCKESLCFLYGISSNQIKRCAKKLKMQNTADIRSIRVERNFNHRSYFGDEYSMEDICKIFDDNGVDVGVMEQRAALVRSSNVHVDAMLWMESYFFQFESQPNSKQIHIDYSYKRTIYEEYRNAANPSAPFNKLSEGQFKELWSSLYDFVRIRKSKRVSGKCWTCAYINELRQKQKGEEVMRACKHLMIMHRGGLFMLER